MATVETLGLASKDVEAGLSFLLARAAAHDDEEKEVSLHRLCAATLRRDAAALAILLDDYPKAHFLLRLSGSEYLQQESAYGLTLLSATDNSINYEPFQSRFASLAGYADGAENEAIMAGDERRRASSVVERVSALQALSLVADRDPFEEGAREKLSRDFQQFPVAGGSPELATPFYFRLLDVVSSVGDGATHGYEMRDLYALSAIREAELRAAQADEYHWPLLLNPSDVVGFDVMFLALAALRHDRSIEPLFNAFGSPESPVALPIAAAQRLADSIG